MRRIVQPPIALLPLSRSHQGGGGEYPLQDGFDWNNGVTRVLSGRYPDLAPQ